MSKSADNIDALNSLAADLAAKVNDTGDESIAGIKTFTSLPVLPATTPVGLQAASAFAAFRKNALINGDFSVWQEDYTSPAMAYGKYMADMWVYYKVGAMVHTGSRSTDVPTIAQAGRKIPYSLLIDCTTVDAAIAAADYAMVRTFVEGYDFVNFAGVGLCLQFWHKHTKTGTYCISFANNGGDRAFIREYTQDVSDQWELATVLVDASPAAGTWDYASAQGLRVSFMLACGSNFHSAAGAWQSAAVLATVNQVNACDNVANNFMLAGVQLEKGSVATEFETRPFAFELALCQRYFEKTFPYTVAPANGLGMSTSGEFEDDSTDTPCANWKFRVVKRVTPTLTLYNPRVGGAAGQWTNTVVDSANARIFWGTDGGCIIDNAGVALIMSTWWVAATADARF